MKARRKRAGDVMRSEYRFDYSKAVRGKHHRRITEEGSNIAILEPDVAKAFPTSAAVNEALRSLLAVSEAARSITARPRSRPARKAGERR